MARGRKKGDQVAVKEPSPLSYFMNKIYMIIWDKRQGTLYGKRDKNSDVDEVIEDEQEQNDSTTTGYYKIGHYGYSNMDWLFEAVKKDMVYRGLKDKKVTEELDELIAIFSSAKKKYDKYMDKFDLHTEVSEKIKTQAKEIQHQLGGDVVEKEPQERKPRQSKSKEEKTKTEANLEKLSKRNK